MVEKTHDLQQNGYGYFDRDMDLMDGSRVYIHIHTHSTIITCLPNWEIALGLSLVIVTIFSVERGIRPSYSNYIDSVERERENVRWSLEVGSCGGRVEEGALDC